MMSENANEVFERLAAEFDKEVGVMAPGKDRAMAAGPLDAHTLHVKLWELWNEKRVDPIKALTQRLGDIDPCLRDEIQQLNANGCKTLNSCCGHAGCAKCSTRPYIQIEIGGEIYTITPRSKCTCDTHFSSVGAITDCPVPDDADGGAK